MTKQQQQQHVVLSLKPRDIHEGLTSFALCGIYNDLKALAPFEVPSTSAKAIAADKANFVKTVQELLRRVKA